MSQHTCHAVALALAISATLTGLSSAAIVKNYKRVVDDAARVSSSQLEFTKDLWMAQGEEVAGLVRTFEEAADDAGMGTDLSTDLALDKPFRTQYNPQRHIEPEVSEDGPATLAEYCSGSTRDEHSRKLREGSRVKANWEEYGEYYPGRVADKNGDGTFDVQYDDGFSEGRVDPEDIKKMKSRGSKGKKAKKRDDAACELQGFVQKMKPQVKDLNQKMTNWVASQRAKLSNNKTPEPQARPTRRRSEAIAAGAAASPAPAVAASPAALPTSSELEALKVEVSDCDTHIIELKKQREENARLLEKYVPKTKAASPSGVLSIDDLIAKYKAMVLERHAEIDDLEKEIQEQERELARLGARQESLDDIDAAVSELEKDVEEAKQKRDELEKKDKLDPELRAILDAIIRDVRKVRQKVDELLALHAKAKADKAEMEEKVRRAAEAARSKAKDEGTDPEEAAALATKAAEREAEDANREADLKTMQAAQEMKKDLDETEKGAAQLDTGIHPHGKKWWRYRYEHAYIESLIMIFVSLLMLIWKRLMHMLKSKIHIWSLPSGAKRQSRAEEMEEESHGTMYLMWFNQFAEQMMVCILVFLTVWIIAKTSLFNLWPMVIKSTPDMRVPRTGEEYEHLALDVCNVFFFAILFYFGLMFAVAHDTRVMTRTLEKTMGGVNDEEEDRTHLGARATAWRHGTAARAMGGLTRSNTGAERTMAHFVRSMEEDVKCGDKPQLKEISDLVNNDFNNFPLHRYLILNIRVSTSSLLNMSWVMWLPVICAFIGFMLLHRFAHAGYVRIMLGFALMVLAVVLTMAWYIRGIGKSFDDAETPRAAIVHSTHNTELIVLRVFQFALFFLCYGVARMICQPWMWELHFWPVVCLTAVALVDVILFVCLVTPAIPAFCAAMSLPPYVDPANMEVMVHVAKAHRRREDEAASA